MSKTPTSPDLSPRASLTPPAPSAMAQIPANLSSIDGERDEVAPSPSPIKDEHLQNRSPSPHTPPLTKAPIKPIIDNNKNPQQFCLRWNNYQSNLTNVFDQLLQNESFVDVTLACDGNSIKAHKMVLSACSPYFQSLFFDNPCQHPIVIMRDVKWPELTAVVEFMYKGEINVRQEQIAPLLRVAEMLKIRGLADVKSDLDLNSESEKSTTNDDATDVTPSTVTTKNNTNIDSIPATKKRITARTEWQINNMDLSEHLSMQQHKQREQSTPSSSSSSQQASLASSSRHFTNRKRRCPSAEIKRTTSSPLSLDQRSDVSASPAPQSESASKCMPPFLSAAGSIDPLTMASLLPNTNSDDCEIKPGIAEMIREEERAKLLQNSQAWLNAAPSSSLNSMSESYQYQLQSMWQKCWSTNQNLIHHLRFRERGPLKSWRPETMAEAIMSVLKDGLSLSQAARKYDIPYPTFVLYANRVHNMLGPSIDGGSDLRPKGRGRPQRILLGVWPEDHIKGVVKTVVFRDDKELREDTTIPLPEFDANTPIFPFPNAQLDFSAGPSSNGGLGMQLNELDSDALSPINISRNNLNWTSLVNPSGSRSTSSRCSS
ncbi:protein bric-a-brac 1-like isoform X2 [Contarinia nasturtii]|uniref:protein bric-a-brac 1-like isoform X2 n=1 Tax=Contarinia nasturtii TaxID=265458 RepID=UPI0012D41E43|nr:protein bric-a-brac 1-like isoform X2 [Contarinia nasturtii]